LAKGPDTALYRLHEGEGIMKLTLITPTPPDICAFGVRSLSAYIKTKGHIVRNIFLPTTFERWEKQKRLVLSYNLNILEDVIELARDSDLIGISLMTNYFDAAVQITEAIKSRFDLPVVWGGAHPTVRPDECLHHADMVCIGEGEEALAELLKNLSEGKPCHGLQNIWAKKNGGITRNGVRPLIQDLDSLPFYDFDLDEHYVIDPRKDKVVELTPDLFRLILPREKYFNDTLHISFRTYTSRGCPHKCSYCINSFLRKIYQGQRFLRKRSVNNVIAEVEQVRDRFPFIETLVFFDDTFLARTTAEIAKFSEIYKERIGLPFHIQVSPTTISREKFEYLVNAGLVFVEMGVQTGSEYTKKQYSRTTSNERVIQAATLIHEYRPQMLPPRYHVILDNPWEKAEDITETLDTIMRLPRPFSLARSSLVLYPGTMLYEEAKRENLIMDEGEEIYRKNFCLPSNTYLNFLIYLSGQSIFPPFLLKIVSKKKYVDILNKESYQRIFALLQSSFEALLILIKGAKSLLRGDLKRIYTYLKREFDRVL